MSWYKRDGKWMQLKADELGYIDPDSFYGRIIDNQKDHEGNKSAAKARKLT